jgi:AcrR family transcriptional regulator
MAARRSRRSASPAARQLSEGEIVSAALRLVRRIGTEKVSMRSLATELGVSPMAIYYHVPNKGALLDLLVDAVLAEVPTPPPDGEHWQQQLKASSLAAFHLLGAYPGLSGVMITRGNTKIGRGLVRYSMSILLAAGFDARAAALAVATYNTYMYGLYAALNAYPLKKRRATKRKPTQPPRAPSDGVSAVAAELRALQVEQAIEFAVDAMLTGIAALSRPAPRKRARA